MNSRTLTLAAYALVAVLAVVVELLARSDRTRLPTFASTVSSGLVRRSTQLGLFAAWWWLGWHFITAG